MADCWCGSEPSTSGLACNAARCPVPLDIRLRRDAVPAIPKGRLAFMAASQHTWSGLLHLPHRARGSFGPWRRSGATQEAAYKCPLRWQRFWTAEAARL